MGRQARPRAGSASNTPTIAIARYAILTGNDPCGQEFPPARHVLNGPISIRDSDGRKLTPSDRQGDPSPARPWNRPAKRVGSGTPTAIP
jgi:hypothetical protein